MVSGTNVEPPTTNAATKSTTAAPSASAALAAKPAPRTRPARAAARTSRMSVNRWGSASVPPSLRSSSGPQQASAITIPLHQRVAAQVDGVAVDGQQAFGRPQQISDLHSSQPVEDLPALARRSEEHTSELQSLM